MPLRIVLPLDRLFELYEKSGEEALTAKNIGDVKPFPLHLIKVAFKNTVFIRKFYMQCYKTLVKEGTLYVKRLSFTPDLIRTIMHLRREGYSAKEIQERLKLVGWMARKDRADDTIRELIRAAGIRSRGSGINDLTRFLGEQLPVIAPSLRTIYRIIDGTALADLLHIWVLLKLCSISVEDFQKAIKVMYIFNENGLDVAIIQILLNSNRALRKDEIWKALIDTKFSKTKMSSQKYEYWFRIMCTKGFIVETGNRYTLRGREEKFNR